MFRGVVLDFYRKFCTNLIHFWSQIPRIFDRKKNISLLCRVFSSKFFHNYSNLNFLRSFFKFSFVQNFIKMSEKHPGNCLKNQENFLNIFAVFSNTKKFSQKMIKNLLVHSNCFLFEIFKITLKLFQDFFIVSLHCFLFFHNFYQKF